MLISSFDAILIRILELRSQMVHQWRFPRRSRMALRRNLERLLVYARV